MKEQLRRHRNIDKTWPRNRFALGWNIFARIRKCHFVVSFIHSFTQLEFFFSFLQSTFYFFRYKFNHLFVVVVSHWVHSQIILHAFDWFNISESPPRIAGLAFILVRQQVRWIVKSMPIFLHNNCHLILHRTHRPRNKCARAFDFAFVVNIHSRMIMNYCDAEVEFSGD